MASTEALSTQAAINLYAQDRFFTQATELFRSVNLSQDDRARVDLAQRLVEAADDGSNITGAAGPTHRFERATNLLSHIPRTGQDTDGGVSRRTAHDSLAAISFLSFGVPPMPERWACSRLASPSTL